MYEMKNHKNVNVLLIEVELTTALLSAPNIITQPKGKEQHLSVVKYPYITSIVNVKLIRNK